MQLELEVPFTAIAKSIPCFLKKLITSEVEQDIIDQLALDSILYLDEIAAYIKGKYALDVWQIIVDKVNMLWNS
ncbi:MAG: hypothetical protein M1813_003823 [Trichoglossum hirsutum]|nr:MAG: hypothetical protein M1813_003823 [Trichoglossum hirsutum]